MTYQYFEVSNDRYKRHEKPVARGKFLGRSLAGQSWLPAGELIEQTIKSEDVQYSRRLGASNLALPMMGPHGASTAGSDLGHCVGGSGPGEMFGQMKLPSLRRVALRSSYSHSRQDHRDLWDDYSRRVEMEGSLEYSTRRRSSCYLGSGSPRLASREAGILPAKDSTDKPALEAPQSSSRPRLHFTPSRGWMNDPCALGYDPIEGKYHLFYQCKRSVPTS